MNTLLYSETTLEAENVSWCFNITQGGKTFVPVGDQTFITIWISSESIMYFSFEDHSTDTKTGCSTLKFEVTKFNQRWGGDCILWETYNSISQYKSAIPMAINQKALSQLMNGNNMIVWVDNHKWNVTLHNSLCAIKALLRWEKWRKDGRVGCKCSY